MRKRIKCNKENLGHARIPKDIIDYSKQKKVPVRITARKMFDIYMTVQAIQKGISNEIYGKRKQKR